MPATPVSLIERIRSDRTGSDWNKFVQIYTPLLRRWLYRSITHPADIEDLIQDILTVVVTKLPEFQHTGAPGAFWAWLRLIVAYRLKNFWRQVRRQPLVGSIQFEQLASSLEDSTNDLSRLWDQEHDKHVVATLLSEIRHEFSALTWEMFDRYVLQGMPPARVAAELNVTRNAVFIARSRILRRLREEGGVLLPSDPDDSSVPPH